MIIIIYRALKFDTLFLYCKELVKIWLLSPVLNNINFDIDYIRYLLDQIDPLTKSLKVTGRPFTLQ
jgi:hypothetical protein